MFEFATNTIFAAGGVTSTSDTFGGITSADITNARSVSAYIAIYLFAGFLIYIFYALIKKIIKKFKININFSFSFLFQLISIIAIIGILAGMAMPNYRCTRNSPLQRQKYCYSNIRVIQGAVEMYNMDNAKMISELVDLNQLEGYIKNPTGLKCPDFYKDGARYKNYGDLTADDEVMCGDDPIGHTYNGSNENNPKCHGNLGGSLLKSK